jgi:hypothetical protein
MRRMLLVLLAGAVASGVSAGAHHSFSAHYFEEQSITIAGEVVEFQYRNPHAWLYVIAPDASGEMRRFAAEWASVGRLAGQGITKDTLRAGDRVVVQGSPGRVPGEYKLHLKGIERPADGWRWAGRGRR